MKHGVIVRVFGPRMRGVLDDRGTRVHTITLGHKRRVQCSCGGTTIHFDFTLLNTVLVGACRHIEALYDGRVTEDRRVAKLHEYKYAYRDGDKPLFGGDKPLFYAQFTALGNEMFRHRYAAMALIRS